MGKQYIRIKLPPADCYKLPYRGYVGKKVRKELNAIRGTETYRKMRVRMLQRQNFKCFYCNCDLSNQKANIEHIVPVKAGGSNHSSNLVMSCSPCNKAKGNKVIHKSKRDRLWENFRERQI